MSQPRNLQLDLVALFLLGTVLFLGLALVTFDAADPLPDLPAPFHLFHQSNAAVYPLNLHVHNACGRWGALAADVLLTHLGLTAYFVVGSLLLLDIALLRRQTWDLPVARSLGFSTAVLGVATLCQLAAPPVPGIPAVGPGGNLGLLGKALLEQHFAQAGSVILAGSITLGGLFLSTDYLLIRWAVKAFQVIPHLFALRSSWGQRGVGVSTVGAGKRKKGAAVRVRGKSLSDLDDFDSELELAAPLPKLKTMPRVATEEDEEEEEEDDVPAVSLKMPDKSGAKSSSDSNPLKIRNPLDRRREMANREREQVTRQLNQGEGATASASYELPSLDLLSTSEDIDFDKQASEVRRKAKILEKTFADFGFQVRVVEIETGPVIAQYEVELEAGLRLSKITSLADDLAIALRVPSVRIVAPIPGKNTVGIEVPNEERQVVRLREVIEEADAKVKKMRIPLFLGKDVSGNALVVDLSTLPHLLIAGRTGTGKSVCLNAIISSILMTRKPDEVRMLMIDPKMVELSGYAKLPHLMHPVVTDMRKAEAILGWAVEKMEERYALLARAGVRHISSYNHLGEEELMDRLEPENDEERASIPRHLPYIVIVADEMADLMMTSGKEVEQHIIRLAQKSRAVGIHLILATQKPTVDVITGLIKSNLPARIAFQVASRTDSRVVLDEMGADKLLGNGDMLFLWPGTSALLRGQGTYLSDEEINSVVDICSTGEQNFVHELMNIKVKDAEGDAKGGSGGNRKQDDMYDEAVDVVFREGRGSVSLLQRALGIGYGRAARLIDFMAEDGIVGTYNGSQAREVVISRDDWDRRRGGGDGEDFEEEPKPAKRSKRAPRERVERPVAKPVHSLHEDALGEETPFEADYDDDVDAESA